jgi:hypothetical protein
MATVAVVLEAVQPVPLLHLTTKCDHHQVLDYVGIQQWIGELCRTSEQIQFRWSL